MLYAMVILEDNVIVATRDTVQGHWTGTVTDALSGNSVTFTWTDQQMGAIMALAFAGEDLPQETTAGLYEVAGPAVENFPLECRPIP